MFSAERVVAQIHSQADVFSICPTAFAGLGRESVTPLLLHLFQIEIRRKQHGPTGYNKEKRPATTAT